MNEAQILEKVQAIFSSVLDNDDIVITENSTTSDIEDWDSLSHIQLVSDIEKEFNIKFNSAEIMSWNNVGEMVKSISQKLGN